MADDLAAGTHRVGELMFEVVPAHLSDTAGRRSPRPLCEAAATAGNAGAADSDLRVHRGPGTRRGAPEPVPLLETLKIP
ncbi:hypothetical protein [Streptomyces sviceus]|uniref:hypothetical protein n=1 Tax=Streptomyces sviceus TaxID=285530 RepID=UPI0033171451